MANPALRCPKYVGPVLLALLVGGAAFANATTLYECQITTGVSAWEDISFLPLESDSRDWIEEINPLTIDIKSGVVRTGKDQKEERWNVLREGVRDQRPWNRLRPLLKVPSLSC
jgi:hypothetical protein